MIDLFNGLSDEELKLVVEKCGDYNQLLTPIKTNNRGYSKVRASLGTLKKGSPLVTKNLPGVVVQLVHQRDKTYVDFVNSMLADLMNSFLKRCEVIYGEESKPYDYSDEQISFVISEWRNEENPEIKYDDKLIYIQIKLACIGIEDSRIENIKALIGETPEYVKEEVNKAVIEAIQSELVIPEKAIKLNDSIDESVEKVRPAKAKKKTPEEKKKSNELALQKKEAEAAKRLEEENRAKEAERDDNAVEENGEKNNGEISGKMIAPEIKKEDIKTMAVKSLENCYLGMIDIRASFYNFVPLGKWTGKDYYSFSTADCEELIPKSLFHNINLYYSIYDETRKKIMADALHYGRLMIFEFTEEDLQENRDQNGTLNQTGYKVSGCDVLKNKKLRLPSDEGLYVLKSVDDLVDDINTSKIVRVNSDDLVEGEQILVNMKNGYYAGPFQVKYSPTRMSYFIQPQGNDNKHTLSCYSVSDVIKKSIELEIEDYMSDVTSWSLYYIKPDAIPVLIDNVSDEILLSAFKEAVAQNGGDISAAKSSDALEAISNSLFTDADIPEEIRERRINRIKEIISNTESFNDNFSQLSDIMMDILLNNIDSEQTNEFFEKLIGEREDFLDKIPSIRILKDRMIQYREDIDNLEIQKSYMNEEVSNIQEELKKKANEDAVAVQGKLDADNERIKKISDRLGVLEDLSNLNDRQIEMQNKVTYLEEHKKHLERESKELETSFINLVNQYSTKVADITFDGFMSSKLIEAASKWEKNEEKNNFNEIVNKVNSLNADNFDSEALVDYIVGSVNKVRPQYDRNMVINLMVCMVQGFLTVFAGSPGCGKTSICNILAKTLGLNKLSDFFGEEYEDIVKRYIPVSVERGWTSKRDFVGYYNPLTKAFEESNREVFDGLRILDAESKAKIKKFPYVILLDEANLSSMEYYWADFMNVCDDLSDNHSINLGNGNTFDIPETLHFVATINNDHTTETLSPRLIDRAWVITLPRLSVVSYISELPDEDIKLVSWENLKATFGVEKGVTPSLDDEIQKIYDEFKKHLSKMDINISPRVDIAIHRYWFAASKIMKTDDYENTPGMIAFDYIVAQKILPMIGGSGDEYEQWLDDLAGLCSKYNMLHSSSILREIIKRGNRQLKYYQFFN